MAEAAAEKPCGETEQYSLAALSCSSIVRSGLCVAFGIGQHTLPLQRLEVKLKWAVKRRRYGEWRAIGASPDDSGLRQTQRRLPVAYERRTSQGGRCVWWRGASGPGEGRVMGQRVSCLSCRNP